MQSLSFVCSKQPSFIRVLQNLNVVFASVSKMPFFSCFSLLEDEVIFFWTMTQDVITPMFITGMSDNWNSGNCESLCRFPQVQNSDARFSNGSGLCIYASSLCSYSFPGCSVRKPGSSLLKRLIVEAVAIFHSNNSCRNHAPLGQGRKQVWYKICESWTKFSHIKSTTELSCTVAQANQEFYHLLDSSECFFPSRKLLQHKYISVQISLERRKGCDTQPQPGWCLLPRLVAQRGTVGCRRTTPMSFCTAWSFWWDHIYCAVSCMGVHRPRGLERTSEVSSTYPWLGAVSSTPIGKFLCVCPCLLKISSDGGLSILQAICLLLNCYCNPNIPSESSLLQVKYFAPYANKDAENR